MSKCRHSVFVAAATLLGMVSAAQAEDHSAHHGGGKPVAWAKLYDAQGKEAGHVKLMQGKDAVSGVVSAGGIAPGAHGIHIHTTGKCDAPGFTTAGGHLNPDGKQHGLQNPQGPHQGDLPDLIAGADGKGRATFAAHTSVERLFDTDGSAFIVHAGADDGKTDPSGNSGARVLCGVFQKPAG